MKKIALLFGLVTLATAGTASAQTSVQLQLGFGAPRPYITGDVLIGQSFVRPVYRPYYYYYPNRYPYYFYEPLPLRYGQPRRVIVFERGRSFFRRDFDRERDWERHHQDWDRDRGWNRERSSNRHRDWNRGRDRDENRDRDDRNRNRRDRDDHR